MTDYKLMPKQITKEMADAFWEEYSKDRADDLLTRCYKALYVAAPTGKLAFAYRTIASLEQQLADVRAQLPSQGGETIKRYKVWHGTEVVLASDYDELKSECERLREERDALRTKTSVSLGVGDGTGNLFVHGDYDSIKRAQELIFECEKLRKDAEWYQIRLEVIRKLYPTTPSDTELDIAINAAMQRGEA